MRLNKVASLPMLGIVQAASILVGQRLGGARPDLAERSGYTGLRWVVGYMGLVTGAYLLIPGVMVLVFAGESDPRRFADVAELVPALLAMAALYSVVDAVNGTRIAK